MLEVEPLKIMRLNKLAAELAVRADRALDDVREEGYEQSEFEYVPLRFYRLPVYIYQITGRYKCVK